MLNIHSFLQGIKRHFSKINRHDLQFSLMVAAYSLIALILVIGSDRFYGTGRKSAETYIKAQSVYGVFEETKGETANAANILRSDEIKDKTQLEYIQTQNFAVAAIGRMAISPIVDINNELNSEMNRITEDQNRIVAEQEKAAEAKAKQAAKEKEEAKAKAEAEKKAKEKRKAKEQKEKEEKEKAAKVKAAKKKLSDEHTVILQRIVEAEATGEGVKGKILVANVILNRVKSNKFPNNVKDVVFQQNGSVVQFSPTRDGRYWSVNVTKETKEAVNRALNGEDYSQGALYFSARSRADKSSMNWFDRNLTLLFKYGGHEFFK